jgi:hypothetical protein
MLALSENRSELSSHRPLHVRHPQKLEAQQRPSVGLEVVPVPSVGAVVDTLDRVDLLRPARGRLLVPRAGRLDADLDAVSDFYLGVLHRELCTPPQAFVDVVHERKVVLFSRYRVWLRVVRVAPTIVVSVYYVV